ncbi:MAG: L,D-transpeptidase [Holosporales bacterium]|jgi:L,D-peptidoglycan transpeptidase YkuD (ErfK/YbiS/YcfS/YnhG family)
MQSLFVSDSSNVIQVFPQGILIINGIRFSCALGKNGVTSHKREGDGKTPVGTFSLRQLFYRPDRVPIPKTSFKNIAINPKMGWSDDATDPAYNTLVPLPHAFGHEVLWREDTRYDYIIPLSYNDDPIIAGAGSAIFFHLATPDRWTTEGCVAVTKNDFEIILGMINPDTLLKIYETSPQG